MGEILWSQMANLQCPTCTAAKTAIDAISGQTGGCSVQNAPKLHWSHLLHPTRLRSVNFTKNENGYEIGTDPGKCYVVDTRKHISANLVVILQNAHAHASSQNTK